MIFIKSAQEYLHEKLKKITKKGFKFVLQDAESVCDLYKESMHYDMFMKHPKSLSFIETIYTSRDDEHNSVKKYKNLCNSKQIGFLRFSYLEDKKYFKKVYGDEINKIKKEFGKHILILTSSTVFKFPHSGNKSFKDPQGMDQERWQLIMDWANYSHKNLFSILEFIRIFSEKSRDTKIIFRPHPSESKDFYLKLFNGFKNVKVENNYSIHASLSAAKNVILPPCSTTSFEASLIKKEIFYLMPKSEDNIDNFIRKHITTKLGTVYETPYSLYNALSNNDSKNKINVENLNFKQSLAKNYLNLNKNTIKDFCKDIENIFNRFFFKTSISYKNRLKFQNFILTISSHLFSLFTNIVFKKKFSYLKYKLKDSKFQNNKNKTGMGKVKRIDHGIFEKLFLYQKDV